MVIKIVVVFVILMVLINFLFCEMLMVFFLIICWLFIFFFFDILDRVVWLLLFEWRFKDGVCCVVGFVVFFWFDFFC